MSEVLENLKYVESHEWVKVDENGEVTVGITDHAQDLLGDIVFVELPEVGTILAKEDQVGVIESVKAASDLYAPVSGKVIAINEALQEQPDLANQSPYEKGWFFKVKLEDSNELEKLLSAAEYHKIL
ncbi:MAG: glycine cleavage system protein GcvH [Neisseriaceae bacterium]